MRVVLLFECYLTKPAIFFGFLLMRIVVLPESLLMRVVLLFEVFAYEGCPFI